MNLPGHTVFPIPRLIFSPLIRYPILLSDRITSSAAAAFQKLALTRQRAVQILKFLIGETDPPVILADDLRAPRLGKFSSGPVSTRLQDCPHAFRLMCGDDRAAGA